MRISTFFIRVGGTDCSFGKIPAGLQQSPQRLPRSRLADQPVYPYERNGIFNRKITMSRDLG